jgi:hypothetical protein
VLFLGFLLGCLVYYAACCLLELYLKVDRHIRMFQPVRLQLPIHFGSMPLRVSHRLSQQCTSLLMHSSSPTPILLFSQQIRILSQILFLGLLLKRGRVRLVEMADEAAFGEGRGRVHGGAGHWLGSAEVGLQLETGR